MQIREQWNRLWRRLPWDGQGLLSFSAPEPGDLRRWAAARFWRRVPWWSRPALVPLARMAWGISAVHQVLRFTRRYSMPTAAGAELLGDCLRTGARPNEAFVWRRFFAPPGPHPLPGRAAGALLSQLGSREEHLLLADKLASARLLAAASLATPPLLEMIPRGGGMDPAGAAWTRPGRLFLKPRHGSAGREAMPIDVIGPGVFRMSGGPPCGLEVLQPRLAALAKHDCVLVQIRLKAAVEIADLAGTGPAPVLRLTTAREPGGAPFLYSALLAIDVPGQHARDFIRGQVRVPVGLQSGRTCRGIWFLHPGQRLTQLPWNQACLEDRALPGFEEAARMTVRAMELVPGLALVNWDLILTPGGPVILEGNTCGDWILTNLAAPCEENGRVLYPLLRRWAVASKRDPS